MKLTLQKKSGQEDLHIFHSPSLLLLKNVASRRSNPILILLNTNPTNLKGRPRNILKQNMTQYMVCTYMLAPNMHDAINAT